MVSQFSNANFAASSEAFQVLKRVGEIPEAAPELLEA
jgi:hypothetical protein